MDARLHPLFRPIQMNGTDVHTYYIEQTPSHPMTAYIACFWESGTTSYTGYNPLESVHGRVLPDGCTDILITYDAVLQQHSFAYCGNYTEPFAIPVSVEINPPADYTFGVRFFPGGARHFHGLPLESFTDRRVPLEECWPANIDELRERMAGTKHFEERVQVMETYLCLLSEDGSTYEKDLMKNAMHRIFVHGGQLSVKELASCEVVSERQLHRKFGEWVGISPKRFSEVVRFHCVLRDIHQGRRMDWSALAQNHGFFDQAHLIRQFRKLYGETPLTAASEHRRMLSELYNRSDEL
ncbi:AraC family transcriptional regulator [Paenibacillus sp. FSL K6-2862]|uniref:AraC family transcriptional regulator n=1 Tax=Paenibacillus sp. FSL K6-2862 TaxID=2921484 RepID=UPI0030FD0792